MASGFATYAPIATLCLLITNSLVEGIKAKSEYAAKTIKTGNGDVYDCVDFYKQPAFNHPLLKNHSFHPEMMPSSRPKGRTQDKPNAENGRLMDIKFKGRSCPRGTVPIRRMNKDDVSRNKLIRHHYTNLGVKSNGDESQGRVYFAVVQSKTDPTKAYYGVGATLSVFNPAVKPNQYSSGETIIRGGSDAIIVGWTVNPMVHMNDTQTRFFIYTIAGESHCFGSQCGFISVRSDIPPDFILKPVSTVGGPIYEYPFFVYQDAKNGNWWLEVGANSTIIGFWPQQIFKGLYDSGTYVACGGEAYGPYDMGRPQMGTGFYPFSRWKKYNAYCKDMVVVDQAHNVVYAHDLERFCTDQTEKHYNVFSYDRYAIYGGPNSY